MNTKNMLEQIPCMGLEALSSTERLWNQSKMLAEGS